MRIKRLKKMLADNGSLPYLITDLNNIRYLTGFSGSNATIIITDGKSYFISDSRYEEYAASLMPPGMVFFLQTGSLTDAVKTCFNVSDGRELFVESGSMILSLYMELKKKMRGVRLVPPTEDFVARLRLIKDDNEIRILREAAGITDRCFNHLLNFIMPGMTEWEIAMEIEFFYKKNGCTGCSFDPIVASGVGSSMPHYIPSMNKKITVGDVLLIDMGCRYMGYNSDLTRTIFVGSIDETFSEIYRIVLDAHDRAIEALKPGIYAGELDEVARNFISEHGYGDNFGHGLGHGLGVEIHEMPAIKKGKGIRLDKNMVITIEPGIYIPRTGGVRIEDMVQVTRSGCEVLTGSSREIIVI